MNFVLPTVEAYKSREVVNLRCSSTQLEYSGGKASYELVSSTDICKIRMRYLWQVNGHYRD